MPVSFDQFKSALGSFGVSVTVVTTIDGAGVPAGLTVTAFSAVSKAPPLCMVCIGHEADAYPAMKGATVYAVNILHRDQQALSTRFATHGIDKFDGVDFQGGTVTGCPLLAGALASLECKVVAVVPSGDHDILIGSVEAVHVAPGEPLAYFRGRYSDVVPRSS